MAIVEGEYCLEVTASNVRYISLTVRPPVGRSALGSLPDEQTTLRAHLGCGRGCPIWLEDAPWRQTCVRPIIGNFVKDKPNVVEVLCPGVENPERLGSRLELLPCYQRLCKGPMTVQYEK